MLKFDHRTAFSRTIGFLTEKELNYLKNCRVAIAGMGGVGGIHLITLTRLGIGNFNIADFDLFELHNFNRQAGASMKTLNHPKIEIMKQQALDINPELDIREFDEGVTKENVDKFLDDVDVYVDGLDAFVLETRELVFKRCYERGIPAFTVAPLGMGFSLLSFLPRKMSFESYFGLRGRPALEKMARFLLGLSPKLLHASSLIVPSAINIKEKRASSTPMGCVMAAGVMGSEVLKVLLKRGKIYAAPWSIQYDAYTHKFRRSYLFLGHQNPWHRFKLNILLNKIGR